MELKTPTPRLKENRPIVQKVMETCPRDSASPEPPLALAKALRVGQHPTNTALSLYIVPLQAV